MTFVRRDVGFEGRFGAVGTGGIGGTETGTSGAPGTETGRLGTATGGTDTGRGGTPGAEIGRLGAPGIETGRFPTGGIDTGRFGIPGAPVGIGRGGTVTPGAAGRDTEPPTLGTFGTFGTFGTGTLGTTPPAAAVAWPTKERTFEVRLGASPPGSPGIPGS